MSLNMAKGKTLEQALAYESLPPILQSKVLELLRNSPGREQKTKAGQTTEVDKPVDKLVDKPVDNQNPVTGQQEKADESNQTNEKGASNVETAKTVETGTERAAQNEASASVTPSEPKPRSSSVPGT
ncbi:MAG: hypothetical protein LBQ81_12380, partial [Zoogloeaceae bacterium]|nr:hypothetical protein [Zoogloeaceae bacterium]